MLISRLPRVIILILIYLNGYGHNEYYFIFLNIIENFVSLFAPIWVSRCTSRVYSKRGIIVSRRAAPRRENTGEFLDAGGT